MPARLSKNALKKALNSLKISQNRPINFDNKIIFQFLKEKFQLNTSNLDSISIKAHLEGRMDKKDLDELISFLKLSESFIYGKIEETDSDFLNQKTISILGKIDKSY